MASSSTSPDPHTVNTQEATPSPDPPQLNSHIIKQGYQIYSFLEATGRAYLNELTYELALTAQFIHKRYPQPNLPATAAAQAKARQTKRSASAEPPPYPVHWATDIPTFRRVVKAFEDQTVNYRKLPQLIAYFRRHDPPSTGNTPESLSPQTTPRILNQPSGSDTPAGATTRGTSAEEIIYNRPIGPSLPDQKMATPVIDPNIQAAITAAIAQYVAQHPPQPGPQGVPGPPGNPGAPGAPGAPGNDGSANGRNDTPRFVASDVGFFDPFYDNKSNDTGPGVEHAGKETYFRDILVFIDRIKDVARVKGAELLRNNLQICLRGEALEWYTCQLTDGEKRLLTYGNDVAEWSQALLERFSPTKASGMATIVKERYSLNDAMRHREPCEYAMTIIRAAKVAKLGDVHNQLDIIWNGLDVEFQSDISPPTEATTLNQFLAVMDVRKQQWWTKASRMTRQGGSMSTPTYRPNPNLSQDKGKSSQYNNPQVRSMPARPMNQGFQKTGYRNMNRPQQNFASPFRQNNQAYNQYQNRQPGYASNSNANPAYPRRDQQQALPAPQTQRQITAGPGFQPNAYGSRQPYQPRPPYQAAAASRPAYQPGPYQPASQPAARPAYQQRAYQASIDNDTLDQEPQEDPSYPDDPNSFHNDYDEPDSGENQEDYVSFPDPFDGPADPDVNFIETSLAPGHSCHLCKRSYKSRNKLFRHLKQECWMTKSLARPETTVVPGVHAVTEENPVTEGKQPPIIESSTPALSKQSLGTTFRGFQHTKADARFAPDSQNHEVCLDPGCPITLGDRALLRTIPDFEQRVQKQASPVPVRGYGNKITYATEYIVIDLYFPGILKDHPALAKVQMEVHLTNDLKANMLIGTDVLTPHKFLLDCASQSAIIGGCQDVKISARSVAKPHSQIKRRVKSKSALTLPPNSVTNVPICYQGMLPDDRDFLFEPELPGTYNLGRNGGIFAHVVDASMTFIQARNATEAPIILPRHTRLGTVVEYAADGCYQVSYKSTNLAACGWRNSDPHKVSAMDATTAIDHNLEHILPNGVTVYGNDQAQSRIGAIVDEYNDVFIDTGVTIDIPEDQWMPIPLKPGAKPKPSKVYPLGQKDREVVDATFDKLQQQGKLRFSTQPTPFSWPCFVVWRDTPQGRKGRVVIDIRGLNAITDDDGYPLPLQSDIIALIAGYRYISTVDGVAWFHQFQVQKHDRNKLTIISHRGQEESSVALMGYKGSPPYVQRQTDALLRPLRAFVRAFVDDIIIFSRTLEEHVSHLRQLFQLLREKRASLAPTKSFLGFPSVTLLGQRVDSLGMSTSEEKIKAITALRFPASLRDLEIFLGLTGWLRNSIPRYAQRAQPLQERKTALTQKMVSEVSVTTATTHQSEEGTEAPGAKRQRIKQLTGPTRKRRSLQLRYEPTKAEIAAFKDLQDAFRAPTFLAHFDRRRKLYVDIDASKAWGFAAMIYHIRPGAKEQTHARADVQPILFLSKSINAAERNYWPTELEIAAIVWVVRKVRHMIEASEAPPVVIYSDHSAAVQIARQTTLSTSSTDKLNLRLVRASQYLSGFNLAIRHKAGKTNVVPDALSRLQAATSPEEKHAVLESLHATMLEEMAPPEDIPVYHMTLVEMSDDFKQRLTKAYAKDRQWTKVLEMLKRPELPSGYRFRKHKDLIYITTLDHEGRQRLCIPESMQQEVFQLAHDANFHGGFHTTYERISPSIYIRGLSKQLQTYLKHCPDCQVNQTKRHPPYGELNPISTPPIPFHTITMDFIVALPYCDGKNELLTLTCKFTKKKLLVPGFDEWTASDWANVFIIAIIDHDWGVPVVIISDRDSRFMSEFWQAVFRKLGTSLATSTAYHPQTDGQSERTNQTVEIALRFHLTATGTDEWLSVVPFLQGTLNNSVTSTGFAPNELAYGFRVRDTLGLLADLPPENLNRLRLIKREEADNAIAFANAMAKTRYDSKHMAIDIKEGSLSYLRLHHGYTIPGVNPKLSNQWVGPFKVLKKVGNLAYRLDLPGNMRIHPVISIAQLEPATDQSDDPYARTMPPPPPVEEEIDDNPALTAKQFKPYEIERLLERRGEGEKAKYLVKWKGYGREHNVWYPVHALAKSQELMAECDARISADPTRARRQQNAGRLPTRQQVATVPPGLPDLASKQPVPESSSQASKAASQALVPYVQATSQATNSPPDKPDQPREAPPKRGRGRPRKLPGV